MSTATAEPAAATKLSQLEALKKLTKVVADTGDFESMRAFKPQDATTNPSLILQAATKPEYAYILDKVLAERKGSGLTGGAQIEDVIDGRGLRVYPALTDAGSEQAACVLLAEQIQRQRVSCLRGHQTGESVPAGDDDHGAGCTG